MKAIKIKYQTPQITEVRLDSEISLVLNSNPPDGPEEGLNQQVPRYFNNDEPIKA